jgi:hypothetical protein
VKPNVNLVEVHPQLRKNGHPVDGARVGAGSLWQVITNHLVQVIYHALGEQEAQQVQNFGCQRNEITLASSRNLEL